MKILIVGSGGREHAIAWKVRQSPKVTEILCAPGNGGIARIARCVPVAADDIDGLCRLAEAESADLVVIGPEVPLTLGLADELKKRGIRAFGPDRACARLEGSKEFTKEFLLRHGIPTAASRTFTDPGELRRSLGLFGYPMVLKADGLASGKGVILAETEKEAEEAVRTMMEEKAFGAAGEKILVEEFLRGTEASVLCFVDRNRILPMESARDYKRIFDGDRGPNTGGMGTCSPNRLFTRELKERVRKEILEPTLAGFRKDGLLFRGILFAGLMIDREGAPKVIEFNTRFGDPETQSVLPRLSGDLVEIMEAVTEDRLSQIDVEWDEKAAVCVVLASEGYPGAYEKGREIFGLKELEETGALVFHAGTRIEGDRFFTDGGRVLGVTALGETPEEAREKAYAYASRISFEGVRYRKDIGAE